MIRFLSSLFLLNLCILISSCNQSDQSENATVNFSLPTIQKNEEIAVEMNMMDLPPPPSSQSTNSMAFYEEPLESKSTFKSGRKLIKEGDITIETEESHQVASAIKQQVQQLEGYISNESIEEYTIEYTLHIPAEGIDSFWDGVGKLKSAKVKTCI